MNHPQIFIASFVPMGNFTSQSLLIAHCRPWLPVFPLSVAFAPSCAVQIW
jgi:hypothetical protein